LRGWHCRNELRTCLNARGMLVGRPRNSRFLRFCRAACSAHSSSDAPARFNLPVPGHGRRPAGYSGPSHVRHAVWEHRTCKPASNSIVLPLGCHYVRNGWKSDISIVSTLE
jgi:hypothetical protein